MPTKQPASVVTRERDGRQLKRTTIYFPVDLAKELAIYCVTEGRQMSAVVTQAVVAHLKGKKTK